MSNLSLSYLFFQTPNAPKPVFGRGTPLGELRTRRIARIFIRGSTMMEREVPSKARRREVPRRVGLGRGAVAPPQYGVSGSVAARKFSKNQR